MKFPKVLVPVFAVSTVVLVGSLYFGCRELSRHISWNADTVSFTARADGIPRDLTFAALPLQDAVAICAAFAGLDLRQPGMIAEGTISLRVEGKTWREILEILCTVKDLELTADDVGYISVQDLKTYLSTLPPLPSRPPLDQHYFSGTEEAFGEYATGEAAPDVIRRFRRAVVEKMHPNLEPPVFLVDTRLLSVSLPDAGTISYASSQKTVTIAEDFARERGLTTQRRGQTLAFLPQSTPKLAGAPGGGVPFTSTFSLTKRTNGVVKELTADYLPLQTLLRLAAGLDGKELEIIGSLPAAGGSLNVQDQSWEQIIRDAAAEYGTFTPEFTPEKYIIHVPETPPRPTAVDTQLRMDHAQNFGLHVRGGTIPDKLEHFRQEIIKVSPGLDPPVFLVDAQLFEWEAPYLEPPSGKRTEVMGKAPAYFIAANFAAAYGMKMEREGNTLTFLWQPPPPLPEPEALTLELEEPGASIAQ